MTRCQFIARNHSDVVLERCRNTRDTNKVVIVVDEGETDILESSYQEARSERPNKKSSRGFVINIDDEKDSDGCDLEKNADTDASTSYLSDDECVMFMEKGSLPKNDRFFPKGDDSQNIHSFHNFFTSKTSAREIEKTESLLSDSDSTDCEIIYEYSGSIRKEWEKAASKKRVQDRFQTSDEHASLSESDFDCRNTYNQSAKIMADFSDNKCSSYSPQSYSENYQDLLHKTSEMSDSFLGQNAFTNPSFSADAEEPCHERCSPFFNQDDPAMPPYMGPSNGESQPDRYFDSCFEANIWNMDVLEKSYFYAESNLQETSMENLSSYAKQSEPSFHHFFDLSNIKEKFPSKDLNNNKKHPRPTHDNASFQPRHNQDFGKTSLDTSCRRSQTSPEALGSSPLESEKLVEEVPEKCLLPSENIKTPPDVQNYLIGERERHKESDEYKRAEEEEWASRQQQLKIQAEEAQRLRRRKKTETMRLLDMEKRKRQRLEEVRESQKKDEETINLKEKFRSDVRKKLDKMELIHSDMASLLRALGIAVDGGPFPLAHEVNAAYKKALLRFHPDRVSRADIRQQVESEEKFKLITRLKEKSLPAA